MLKLVTRTFSTLPLILLVILSTLTAEAGQLVELIEVSADYYPGLKGSIGLELNKDHSINRVYQRSMTSGNMHYYTFEQLSQPHPIVATDPVEGKVYNLIYLKLMRESENGYDIEMKYMRNGLFKNKLTTVMLHLNYNKSSHRYELIDSRSDRVVTRANATTNYWNIPFKGKTVVGIADIVTN